MARGPNERRGAASTPWHLSEEPLLGERILVVTDGAHAAEARQAHPGLVVYTTMEISVLRQMKDRPGFAEMVQAVHALKRHFDGVVLASGRDRFDGLAPTHKPAPMPKPREAGGGRTSWWSDRRGDT